jgi:hypothetical protein
VWRWIALVRNGIALGQRGRDRSQSDCEPWKAAKSGSGSQAVIHKLRHLRERQVTELEI